MLTQLFSTASKTVSAEGYRDNKKVFFGGSGVAIAKVTPSPANQEHQTLNTVILTHKSNQGIAGLQSTPPAASREKR